MSPPPNCSGRIPGRLKTLLFLLPIFHAAFAFAANANRKTTGQFGALVAPLQQALEACPALPASVVESSVEHCLRRPFPGTTGSTLAMFVRGVLSLVTQSPRALGPAVVSLLVRFVSETDCQTKGEILSDKS